MTQRTPQQTRNLFAFGMDYIFFALSLGFANLSTIVPSFAARLGASTEIVGAIITTILIAWSLPQMVAGNLASRYARKKPLLMKMVVIGRPVTLVIPMVIWATGGLPAWLNLTVALAAYCVFFSTDAFATIAWFDLLGRAFPAERRGTYISIWQAGKAAGLLGVSALVGAILSNQGPAFPNNYAILFVSASGCLTVSALALAFIHEPAPEPDESPAPFVAWRELLGHLRRIWVSDARFRFITIARILFSLSAMAGPFYVLYATETLHFPQGTIGIFIFAQTIGGSLASLVLGRVADRKGAQRTLQIGIPVVLLAPLAALTLALAGGGTRWGAETLYVLIYICVGIGDNLMMLGFLNYLIDASSKGQRPVYMGLFNAISTIGMLGPTLAGWLVGRFSYSVLFATALAFGAAALAMTFRLPQPREIAPLPVPAIRRGGR